MFTVFAAVKSTFTFGKSKNEMAESEESDARKDGQEKVMDDTDREADKTDADSDSTTKQAVPDVKVDRDDTDKQAIPDIQVDKEGFIKQAAETVQVVTQPHVDREETIKQAVPAQAAPQSHDDKVETIKQAVPAQAVPQAHVDKEETIKQAVPAQAVPQSHVDKEETIKQAVPAQVDKDDTDKQTVPGIPFDKEDTEIQAVPDVQVDQAAGEPLADLTDKHMIYTSLKSSSSADISDKTEIADDQKIESTETQSSQVLKTQIVTGKSEESATDVIGTDNIGHVAESTKSEIQEGVSEIVIDGTAFPAEYFGGEGVTSPVAQQPVQTSVLESASVHVATSDATISIQPTQATMESSKEIREQKSESQPSATKDLSEEIAVQESKKQPIQGTKEQLIQETESKGLDATSSDSYNMLSTATKAIKMDLKIEPSETVSEHSAAHSKQPDFANTQAVPIGQLTDSKPLVMHTTDLKPSSSSSFSSLDLKKYETPYQASTKILPLNQGVDVNNRHTPAVVQSSIETSVVTVHASSDSENSEARVLATADYGVEVPRAEDIKENVTVESDSVLDQVQPSLSQDPYKTVDFIARKTLSAESARKEAGGQYDIEIEQPQIPKPQEIKQDQDQAKQTSIHPHRQLPDLPLNQGNQPGHAGEQTQEPVLQNQQTTPVTLTDKVELPVPPTLRPKVDENNNVDDSSFKTDPSLTQKLPDEKQDATPETSLVQKMEPQLKLLVDKVQYQS